MKILKFTSFTDKLNEKSEKETDQNKVNESIKQYEIGLDLLNDYMDHLVDLLKYIFMFIRYISHCIHIRISISWPIFFRIMNNINKIIQNFK